MPDLTGKVALITGAGSGIGACTALYFVQLGCKVTIVGRTLKKLEEVYQQCDLKTHMLVVQGDVADTQSRIEMVEKTIQHFGQLDILINNAGLVRAQPTEEVTESNYDYVMSTNVRGLFFLSQQCIPHLRKTKGNIVNISSMASHRAGTKNTIYCASKAAVDHLTRNLALEFGSDQIRVNTINPGVVPTEIFYTSGLTKEQADEMLLSFHKQHALGRNGTVEEMAKPIAFLASDDASFITGATLLVDGGLTLKLAEQ